MYVCIHTHCALNTFVMCAYRFDIQVYRRHTHLHNKYVSKQFIIRARRTRIYLMRSRKFKGVLVLYYMDTPRGTIYAQLVPNTRGVCGKVRIFVWKRMERGFYYFYFLKIYTSE